MNQRKNISPQDLFLAAKGTKHIIVCNILRIGGGELMLEDAPQTQCEAGKMHTSLPALKIRVEERCLNYSYLKLTASFTEQQHRKRGLCVLQPHPLLT